MYKEVTLLNHLKHVLEEVLLLLLALPKPAQHELTEIREVNQPFPKFLDCLYL